MAREAEVIREGRRLADIVHRHAEREGWPRETYRVFITANTYLPRWRMVVVSDRFNKRIESDWFNDIMDEVERQERLGEVSCPVGLSLWRTDLFESLGRPWPRDEEIEIPDELINPGVMDVSSPSQTHSR